MDFLINALSRPNHTTASSNSNQETQAIHQSLFDVLNPLNIVNNVASLAGMFVDMIAPPSPSGQSVSPDTDYDESHPFYHYYEHETIIASVDHLDEATKEHIQDLAFDGLTRFAAPGADGSPVSDGEIASIGLGGSVTHFVDEDNLRVTNVTMDGHVFEDGEVERLIVEEDGFIKIKSIGQGINESALQEFLNLVTYDNGIPLLVDGFSQLDEQIVDYVQGNFDLA